jgi:hypothetical protein
MVRLFPGLICLLAAFPCLAAEPGDLVQSRPAFSAGDQPATAIATCQQVRAMAEGVGTPDFRIDLAVSGAPTSVRTDGALWYLTVCNLPDVRIMCVAYQSNDMKTGDTVIVKGGYRRVDPNHILLDPCLASRPDEEPDPAPPN